MEMFSNVVFGAEIQIFLLSKNEENEMFMLSSRFSSF